MSTYKLKLQLIRAGSSPTFQDPGTPLDGFMGTRVPASLMEQVLRFKIRVNKGMCDCIVV